MKTVRDRAMDTADVLRGIRADLALLIARVDVAIESAESLVDCVATLESDVQDSTERARMRTYGKAGEVVCEVAKRHGVALRLVLGPGQPHPSARAARRDAMTALADLGYCSADVARVLNVSAEAARGVVTPHKKAA